MRIGINALFLAPGKGGGMERYLANMVRAMAEKLPQNSLIAFASWEGLPCLEGACRVVPGPVPASMRWARILWEQIGFPRVVKEWECDVMISFGNVSPAYLPCPSLAVIHDLIPFAASHGFSPLEKLVAQGLFRTTARMADQIITVSQFSKDQIMETLGTHDEKVSVIPGACAPIFSNIRGKQECLKAPPQQPYLLAGASALPHKNLNSLLEAFRMLLDRRLLDLRLVITHNGGSGASIMDRVKGLGLEDKVSTTGWISDPELARLYQDAVAFIYPSLYEGFGLPILEAMACGAPVIASNRASLPEIAGDAALLVDSKSPEKLAWAIKNVLEDENLRTSLAARGRQRALEFSWEKSAGRMLALAREVYRGHT